MTSFVKDPDANLDYTWDWADWLAPGDTITSHAVAVVAGDVVIGTHSNTTTTVTAWLSAGTAESEATVRARVTTAQGRIDDRTIRLTIRQR